MNLDYLYCINKDTCIHRRGCKRWIGNYTDDEAIDESNNNTRGYVNNEHCISGNDILSPYYMLDRFKNSTGEE